MNFRERTDELRTYLLYGDVKDICEKAGCSKTLLKRAFKAESFSDLTPAEKRVYKVFVEVAGRRKEEAEREDMAVERMTAQILGQP